MCPLASVYMSVAESGTRLFWINNGQGVVISVCNQCCYQKEVLTHILWREEDVFVSILIADVPLSI